MRLLPLLLLCTLAGAADNPLDTARALLSSGDAARAAELLRGQSPPSTPVLMLLAEAELALKDYPQARIHATQCAAPTSDPVTRASCLTTQGRAESFQGLYADAVASFTQAAQVARAANLARDLTAVLNNLGNTHYFLGDYTAAFHSYREAAALVAGHSSEAWAARLRQLTQANLATLYQRLGQYSKALAIYQDLSAAPALSPAEQLQMRGNLGVLYRRLGDPYKALDEYEAAMRGQRAQQDPVGELPMLKNSGIALAMDIGDYRRAIAIFLRARDLAFRSGNRREETQADAYLAEALRRFGQGEPARQRATAALELARQIDSKEDQWKALFTLGKIQQDRGASSAALEQYRNAIVIIEGLRGSLAEASLRTSFLGDKRSVYDAAIRLQLRAGAAASTLFPDFEQVRARTLSDRAGAPATLSHLQSRLDPHTALLEYWTDGQELGLLWITRGATGQVSKPAANLAAIVARWGEQLRSGSAQWRSTAQDLGALLLPATLPAGITNLIMVPDGPLDSVPFEALATPGGALLLEQYEVSYLPSAALFRANPISRGWRLPWQPFLDAFANPVLAKTQDADLFSADLPPLPGSEDEARNLRSLYGPGARIFSGPEDRKTHLSASAQVAAVHLSTHGVADEEDAERSRLVFSSSGAGQDYLFGPEIEKLPWREVRLVTLAACDTGSGVHIAGEGVQALSRSFLSTGAASVVSTLWRVGDRSTAQLMLTFYDRLRAGATVAAALRFAKLELLKSGSTWAHPRYWAAFTVSGDPATTLPRRITFAELAGFMLIVAGAVWLALIRPAPKTTRSGERTASMQR